PATIDQAFNVCGCAPSDPNGPQYSCNSYDTKGQLVRVYNADGTITAYRYDGLGRQRIVTENAGGLPELQRHTAYDYDGLGRLTRVAAVLPNHLGGFVTDMDPNWNATDGTIQITQMTYGADIVNTSGVAQSANNALVRSVRFPSPSAEAPHATDDLVFTYYEDGSIAARTDARGIVVMYQYDELG